MEAVAKAKTADELRNVLLRHDQATLVSTYTYAGDITAIEACLDDYIEKYPRTRDTLHLMVPIIHFQRTCPGCWLYRPRSQGRLEIGGGIVLTSRGDDIVLEAIALYETDQKNVRRYAKELDEWLVKLSIVNQKHVPRKRKPAGTSKDRTQPTERTIERYKLFEEIRKKHPTASQAKVATLASDENNLEYSENTVRNTYRLMGVKWPRADRVR